jgi:phenylacetate-CoA ligase
MRLYSVAEVLEPQDQREIESAFETPVLQIYQCTEGLLGISCERGSLHVQEDLVALQFEPLDGGGERVMPIVTDLHRLTQPIIRYRLNDVLQLSPQACACGSEFRVIRTVEGRSDDACYLEATDGGLVLFFPDTIRRMVLLATDEIQDYQVFQEKCGSLRIHVEPTEGADFDHIVARLRASVTQVAQLYGCRVSQLAVEQGLVKMPPGAKRRRVQRLG